MKTIKFDNGDQMPVLGLGTWKSAPGEVHGAVKEALRLGYRHVDCAYIYGNEAEIGRALSESFKEGVTAREQMWITSKLWNDSHAREDVLPALKQTLSDLQLEYLDLYLVHWPVALRKGVFIPESAQDMIALDDVPISETWEAMEASVDQGLCRHIGVSNFSITRLGALLDVARVKPEMNQIELHPYLQQRDMMEFCGSNAIPLTAYSPLGSPDRPSGLKEEVEPGLLQDPILEKVAERHGVTPAQVLISWAVQRGTAVIPKSVNPARMKQNLDAVELALSEHDMRQIAGLERNHRYINGEFWAIEGGPYTVADLWDE